MPGKRITQLDSMPEPDGTELFVLSDDPSGTPVSKKVSADFLPVRAQVMFTVPGTLATGDDQAPWFVCSVPTGVQLLSTDLVVKTAPTGADIIIDIMWSPDCGDNWTTIYSVKPSIADGDKCDDAGTLSIPYIEQGDILRFDIDQVGSGTAGADLTVSLHVRQGVGDVTGSTSSSTTTTTLLSMSWQSPTSVYSSCGYEASYPPENLIDGDVATLWMHFVHETHEVIFDLGETKYVTKVRLYVYDMTSSQWGLVGVYVSDDPTSWGISVLSPGSFKDGELGAEWVEQTLIAPKSGRYIKLTSIYTDHLEDYVVGAEFEVYAS